jgi:dienelactone hydrolase
MFKPVLLFTAAVAAASVAHAQAHSLAEDAKTFGARETFQSLDISPDGSKLLYIGAAAGKASLLSIVDVASGAVSPILKDSADPEKLYWCAFASNTQVVCRYGAGVPMNGDIVGFSRLITLGTDGANLKQLGVRERFHDAGIRQSDGSVLDWLPDQAGSVLMARNYVPEVGTTGSHISDSREGLGVDRIDLSTLKVSGVEIANDMASGFMTDGRGKVRLMTVPEYRGSTGELTGIIHYRYRQQGSRDWKNLGDYDERDGSGIYPLAIEADSDSLYLLKEANGRDALYRTKLDGSGNSTLVAANPAVDIDSVVRLGRGQKVIGYTYADDSRHTVYFDPEYTRLSAALSRALPGNPGITFDGATADGKRLLVSASGGAAPGSYYYYDKSTRHLEAIGPARPELDGRTLAAVRAVRVPAAANIEIPAYLTLPPGSTGHSLPAIVLPHGGPSARDELGFDWLAQFLAARGYAVIQPNYRGSAGYGDDWMGANGFQAWETSIGDISAAARYLVAQGIADPKRLAIVGWSYGGYAALQSAAVDPTLYKAAVAIAPVTDLSLLKRESRNFTNSALVSDFVGSGEHLALGSPLKRASSISVPVLLVHGDMDANVGIVHSEKMLQELKEEGKPVELLRFAGLDHQLDDSRARTQMLTKIGQFLDAAIGH